MGALVIVLILLLMGTVFIVRFKRRGAVPASFMLLAAASGATASSFHNMNNAVFGILFALMMLNTVFAGIYAMKQQKNNQSS
ncbi:hypothetical protein SAMN05421736_10874 [Evansella caseinilytica]|uniref:Uncharacterized protein n=1 Tax=Evansella caseinilytica TaxID=1503961 RepID=A0A1H3RH00_9BACI|nr:hypothetical protein [Evansella caseinilytica]SDZ24209.1 hypothetical protein SAMN05421736_10874 [Evansella caseinilytica]